MEQYFLGAGAPAILATYESEYFYPRDSSITRDKEIGSLGIGDGTGWKIRKHSRNFVQEETFESLLFARRLAGWVQL
jgi:hypothetical protein